jgi:hypothetical protein
MNPLPSAPALVAADFCRANPGDRKNILFVVPHAEDVTSSLPTAAKVIEMARHFAQDAYVYVARAGQQEMEDDEFGVRHMPLDPEHLPSFGALTQAFIWGDRSLACAVAEEHPEAEVFLVHSSAAAERSSEQPASLLCPD